MLRSPKTAPPHTTCCIGISFASTCVRLRSDPLAATAVAAFNAVRIYMYRTTHPMPRYHLLQSIHSVSGQTMHGFCQTRRIADPPPRPSAMLPRQADFFIRKLSRQAIFVASGARRRYSPVAITAREYDQLGSTYRHIGATSTSRTRTARDGSRLL
jgi:hypothetical protein